MEKTVYRAIGLMSGTSLDGVDAVLIETDGDRRVALLAESYISFHTDFQTRLKAMATGDVPLSDVLRAERELMARYVEAIDALGVNLGTVDVIGGHGQTIRHLPDEGLTWQLADASFVAEKTGLPVVMDLRRRDMAAGGQGAPLASLYHRALLPADVRAAGVLNIGGVANLTWFDGDTLRASDTGPGMGLMNEVVKARTGADFDADGALTLAGVPDMDIVARALDELDYWRRPLPRTADRYDYDAAKAMVEHLNEADACATLAALTAAGVARTMGEFRAEGPVYVVGGGGKNPGVMAALNAAGVRALPGTDAGLRGQTMEAECFAWLAVRHMRGLPTSEPATTGASRATVGGVLARGR